MIEAMTRAFAFGLASAVALATSAYAQSSITSYSWADRDLDVSFYTWKDVYAMRYAPWRSEDCQNVMNTHWKYSWQSISKESMDKCEYKKITEIIENNQKVLKFEFCRALWQELRYYRAKHRGNVEAEKLYDRMFGLVPNNWEDAAVKGALYFSPKYTDKALAGAATGVVAFDMMNEVETAEEARGLYRRYYKTYRYHQDLFDEIKKYWDTVQAKLPDCPPTTKTSGGARKKQPDPPKDPVPPDPVKTEPSPSGGSKTGPVKETRRDDSKDSGAGGKTAQDGKGPADTVQRPTQDSLSKAAAEALEHPDMVFISVDCVNDPPSSGATAGQPADCDRKVVNAASAAADIAAAWAAGMPPGGGAADFGKPGDAVAFWGDACHAVLELAGGFQPPPNRDAKAAAAHSRNRAKEAIALAAKLGASSRELEGEAAKESDAAAETVEKALNQRRDRAAARRYIDDAKRAAERAAKAQADAILRQRLGWDLFDIGILYLAHADRTERGQAGKTAGAGLRPINAAYCSQRINYTLASLGRGGVQPVGTGGAASGQYPPGAGQPAGSGQPVAGTSTGTAPGYAPGYVPGYPAPPYGQGVPGAAGAGAPGATGLPSGGQRLGTGAPAGPTFGGAPSGSTFGTQPGGRSSGGSSGTIQRPSTLSDDVLKQGGGKSGGTTR